MRWPLVLLAAGCGRELFLPPADGTAKIEILMVGDEGSDEPDEMAFFDLEAPFSSTFEIGSGTRFEAMTFTKTATDLGLRKPDDLGKGRAPKRDDYRILEATAAGDELAWTPVSEGQWSASVMVPGRCAQLQLSRQEEIDPTNFAGLLPRNGKAISIQRNDGRTSLFEVSLGETRPLAAPAALDRFAAHSAFLAIDGSIVLGGLGGYLRLTGDPIDGVEEISVPGERMFASTMTEDGAIFGMSELNRLIRVEPAGVSVLREFSGLPNPKLGGIAALGAQDVLASPLDGSAIFRYRFGTITTEDTEIDPLLSGHEDFVGTLVDVPGTGTFAGTDERVLERQSDGWVVVFEGSQVISGVRVGAVAPFRGGIVFAAGGALRQYYTDEGLCPDQDVSMESVSAEFLAEIDGGVAVVGIEVAGVETTVVQIFSD